MGSTGGLSGDEVKAKLDEAKHNELSNGQLKDHQHSRYVVMMDDPLAAAKSIEGIPSLYFTYLCGSMYLFLCCAGCGFANPA